MTTTHVFTPPTPTTTAESPTPDGLQKAGGIAALVTAVTYVAGFGLMGAYLVPEGFGDGGPSDALEFLVDHHGLLSAWYGLLYLVGGVALVVVTLGVHARLAAAAPGLRLTAGALGIIWSGLLLATGMIAVVGHQAVVDLAGTEPGRAATVHETLTVIQNALGGGIELVGGLWILLVSLAARPVGAFGRRLCGLGLLIGGAGIATVVPALEAAAVGFGLGFIVWFIWAGVVLSRRTP